MSFAHYEMLTAPKPLSLESFQLFKLKAYGYLVGGQGNRGHLVI